MLCDILKQNFVDTSGVHFDSEARTALAFVMLKADAELEFLFFRNPSADMLLHESEIDKNLYRSSPNISSALMEVLGRLTTILNPAADLKGKMEMSHQIQEYECLVNKLKEELRVEKLKAKEVAEDLT
ncbi:hypothetical protein AHAS_Ahas07G0085300 [Arachis hypogaea]